MNGKHISLKCPNKRSARKRLRSVALVMTLMLVIGLLWHTLSLTLPEADLDIATPSPPPSPPVAVVTPLRAVTAMDLYVASDGVLFVDPGPLGPLQNPPLRVTKTESVRNTLDGPPAASAAATRPQEGKAPALRAGFDAIGWPRYVKLMNSVDARFYLVSRKDGTLGPEIDIRTRRVVARRDLDGMDLERPYLLKNSEIARILREARPGNEYRPGEAIVLLKEWSSRFLWGEIGKALAQQGLTFADVTLINADYAAQGERLYLALHEALRRQPAGEKVPLKIMVELPS